MDRVIIIAEQLAPIQTEMPDDQYEGREENKNIPQKIRHKKRFRNEPSGIAENDIDGLSGQRNQFRGMGTDNSYVVPGCGVGGQALGY